MKLSVTPDLGREIGRTSNEWSQVIALKVRGTYLKGNITVLEPTAKRSSVSYKVTRKGMSDGIPFSFDFADVVLTGGDDLEIDGDEPRLFIDGRNYGPEQIEVRIGPRSWIIGVGEPFVYLTATQGSVRVSIAA